jgi:hypothetical protein
MYPWEILENPKENPYPLLFGKRYRLTSITPDQLQKIEPTAC